jgi:hypothetical protein
LEAGLEDISPTMIFAHLLNKGAGAVKRPVDRPLPEKKSVVEFEGEKN